MTLLLSDMRTVRLQSLTFRITQSYDLRVSHLIMHPSVCKELVNYFTKNTALLHSRLIHNNIKIKI
jgi:hypothetical protein